MNKITLDQATLDKFNNLKERAELCDALGCVVGYFMPVVDRSMYDSVEVPYSEEELDRIEQETGGRSLAEIMKDLEKR